MARRRKGGHYHTGVHVSPKAGECHYRSGWELEYMKHLDADPDVLSFGYETMTIPYVSNYKTGRLRKYIPDFVIEHKSDGKIIVEIKPSNKLEKPSVAKKLVAGRRWCMEHGWPYRVLTEIDLKGLGVL